MNKLGHSSQKSNLERGTTNDKQVSKNCRPNTRQWTWELLKRMVRLYLHSYVHETIFKLHYIKSSRVLVKFPIFPFIFTTLIVFNKIAVKCSIIRYNELSLTGCMREKSSSPKYNCLRLNDHFLQTHTLAYTHRE